MNKLLLAFTFILLITGFNVIRADSAPPTYLTTFSFQENEQPVTQPVTFDINCYGNAISYDDNNSGRTLKISQFSTTSQSYGSAFDTSNLFETYRANLQYCDLSVSTGGKQFNITKFIDSSLNGLDCKNADYDTYDGSKYYKNGVDVTDKLAKDSNGYAYDKICKMTIQLSSTQTQSVNMKPVESQGFISRLFSYIGCFFKSIFKNSCSK
ncbi:MAG: hypothetical protein WCK48_01600 [bacterium]